MTQMAFLKFTSNEATTMTKRFHLSGLHLKLTEILFGGEKKVLLARHGLLSLN